MTTQLYITGTDEEFTAVERFRNITKKWSHPSVCYKRRVEEVTGEDNTIKTFTILSCPKKVGPLGYGAKTLNGVTIPIPIRHTESFMEYESKGESIARQTLEIYI